MGLVTWIAKSRPFQMIYMFNINEESGQVEWHESGIRRYIATLFIVALGASIGLMATVSGFPGYRIYTILLVLTFIAYYKLAEAMPKILSDMDEFSVEMRPGIRETPFYNQIEKQLNNQDGLSFNPDPVDKD